MEIGDKVYVYKGTLKNNISINERNIGEIIDINDDIYTDWTGDEYESQRLKVKLNSKKIITVTTGDLISLFPKYRAITLKDLTTQFPDIIIEDNINNYRQQNYP
ncbi:hypothetical protein [Gracilibacillus dipsosauri]|uniref:hypothetical protein n=1 Tax=Gracilibacillus dipsosauri TaxID=178340 RepID=UPI002409C8B3